MMKTLKRLGAYMGGRKYLLPCSVALSAVNGLLSLVPFILMWLVVRTLLIAKGNLSNTPLIDYALWAFIISVANVLLYFLALMLSHLAAFRIETNMRRKAMQRLMRAPLGYLDEQNTGRMRKIIDEDSGQTHTFVAHLLPDVASCIVAPIGVIVLLFAVDWQLGTAAMIPLIGAIGIMGYMMNPKNNQFQRLYLDAQEKMGAEAVEYVRGIPVVKVFQQTVFSFKRFYDSIISYRDLVIKCTLVWRTPMSFYILAINAFAFILVPTAIILIGLGGDTSTIIANVILYVVIAPLIASNVMKAMYLSQDLFMANEAVERLEQLTDIAPLSQHDEPKRAETYDIRFNDVSFRYEGAEKDAVSHINLTIPEGKTVALVGASGSGKTTIARLIPRFWDVRHGSVTIGGVDVRDMRKDELMRNVSFVFQNTRLFKTSLIENLRYGNPDATTDQINRAIDLSQSREIIDRLPQGLDTVIGAEGTYLSGGEQQRIVLARAILKDAPIIVLDEATAFADPENEQLIRKALAHLTQGKTVLMIAHRLTTVQDADSIVVVDDGEIVEQGTHKELLSEEKYYHRMWNEYQQSVSWKLSSIKSHKVIKS
ncbi:ABC transporter ATP-binding protein/permease [Hoylesella buccalis]|uniref:ABC transporter ATP-binding protein n=1 Tax=Hoylesella buccalis TaxID=28127 RepID=UPI001D139B6E|nr:ABC transporter ATP-binding protein [Hoylesella buccalis]UEA62001.1 ABC transporter ATP-binding protein/permease [Hoylesella buccalis]UWP50717.1 ABC transporter ATP-binding protein/permease [Hoylesella buccalis ATCC 35310]